jgi:hypothetical protein
MIVLREVEHPESWVPPRYFIGSVIGDKVHITRSGIVLVPNESPDPSKEFNPYEGLKGETTSDWRRERLVLAIDLQPSIQRVQPRAPSQNHLWGIRFEQWVATAAPNAMFNVNVSNNAGWAVDTVIVEDPRTEAVHSARLDLDLAVRDNDGYLYRISYYLHIIGRLEEVEIKI